MDDGIASIYKHKKKKIDMFVVLLKVKGEDFAINLANSFREIGLTTYLYYQKSSERYITRGYSLSMFGILKAIRKYTELALKLLVKPLLINNSFKYALLRGSPMLKAA